MNDCMHHWSAHQVIYTATEALWRACNYRDGYTAQHSLGVVDYAAEIAGGLDFCEEESALIVRAAQIHDVGKIGIPLEYLTKVTPLTRDEFTMVRGHAEIGYRIIKDLPMPQRIMEIVLQHHERLDGSGYPFGLQNDEICIGAQIIAVADTIDAMMKPRPYRKALGSDQTIDELLLDRGSKLNADVVDVAVKILDNSE